jgi:hypothetical protein
MGDEQDAPPSRVGQAQEPKWYITLGIMADGTFACDGNCLDEEMVVRSLLHKGSFEMDRYFGRKAFEALSKKAQQDAVLNSMMGREKKKIDKRIVLG